MSGRDANTRYMIVIGAELSEPIAEHVLTMRHEAEVKTRKFRKRWPEYEIALEEWQFGRADGQQFIGTLQVAS
jgi:hypothetical protein